MDEKRLGGILQTMKDIETEVNKYCQQWDIIYRMYHEYTWKYLVIEVNTTMQASPS